MPNVFSRRAVSLEESLAALENRSHDGNVEDLVRMLQMCRQSKNLNYARKVQLYIHSKGLEFEELIGSFIVLTFVECQSLSDAEQAFRRLAERNEYAWTSLIQGFLEYGECEHAFNLYNEMKMDGIYPNTFTFQFLLRSCVQLKSIDRGRELHYEIACEGHERHPYVGTALVDMYAKCGSMEEARDVLNEMPIRDVVVWTALITGYTEHGSVEQALDCLDLMEAEGISPNAMTLVCTLKGCSSAGAIHRGQEIHSRIISKGLEGDLFIGNVLVDMYAKNKRLKDAQEVFKMLPLRDVVSWTALIMGFGEGGLGAEALAHLELMRNESVPPNDVTYVCSLKACAGSGAPDIGRTVHTQIVKEGFDIYPVVGNALVDMYAKCSSLLEAWKIFNDLKVQDLVSWSALISGHARQGESKYACHLFEKMKEEGIKPDGIVFLTALNACSHAGLITKGQEFFEAMCEECCNHLTLEHYNCMLDILGRAGLLKDALIWLDKMPFKPNFVTWSTLLFACQKWGNVELARHAFDAAVKLDANQVTIFIVMSTVYADAGMLEAAKEIDVMRSEIHNPRLKQH